MWGRRALSILSLVVVAAAVLPPNCTLGTVYLSDSTYYSDGAQLDPVDAVVMADMLAAFDFPPWRPYRGTSVNPCEWEGVTCLCGHVAAIFLSNANTGSGAMEVSPGVIPTSIAQLVNLQHLKISCRGAPMLLAGPLPSGLFNGALSNLDCLEIDACSELRMDVAGLNVTATELTELSIINSGLYGNANDMLCNDGLHLYLVANSIRGSVPWQGCLNAASVDLSWNQLQSLGGFNGETACDEAEFMLEGNGMSGSLDDIAAAMPCLSTLEVTNNGITGTVPAAIWNINKVLLDLNRLTGQFPSPPDSLSPSTIQILSAINNQLTGTVPALPAGWAVQIFDVSHNQLVGFDPYFNTSQYISFSAAQNMLVGELPFTPLGMVMIDVSHNQLTGCPLEGKLEMEEFGPTCNYSSYATLHEVHLQNNLFSCPVLPLCTPVFYATGHTFTPLDYLDISYNSFPADPIVFGARMLYAQAANLTNQGGNLYFQSFVLYADISYNNLYGSLPKFDGCATCDSSDFDQFSVFPAYMIGLDVSFNQLSGGINARLQAEVVSDTSSSRRSSEPEENYTFWSLETLNITGNWNMSITEGNVPLEISTTLTFRGSDYSCYALQIRGSDTTTIVASPEFYNYTYCQCDDLFFGALDWHTKDYSCSAMSMLCAGGDLDCIDMNNTNSSIVTGGMGYYPRPSLNAATHLLPCPVLNPSSITYACSGQCTCASGVGLIDCECSDLCSPGYGDLFCSRCDDGYFALGLLCVKCEAQEQGIAIGVAAFALLSSLVVMVITAHPSSKQATSGRCLTLRNNKTLVAYVVLIILVLVVSAATMNVASMGIIGVSVLLSMLLQLAWHLPSASAASAAAVGPSFLPVDLNAFTILITFLQTVSASVPSGFFTFEVHSDSLVPGPTVAPLHVIAPSASRSIAQLEPYGVECYISVLPLQVYFYGTLILPFLLVGLTLTAFYVTKGHSLLMMQSKRFLLSQAMKERRSSAVIYLLNYLVYNAFVEVIQIFNCNQSGSEEYYMLAYPWIQCFDKFWYQMLAVGLVVAVGYVIAFAIVAWFVRATIQRWDIHAANARFSFLISSFKPDRWWFALVILLRRVVVAIGLSGFPAASALGPLTVLGALVAGLVAQTTASPYLTPALNWMETAQLSLLMVTYAAVVLLNAGFAVFSVFTRAALLVLNVIFVFAAVVYTLSPSLRKCFSRCKDRREGGGRVNLLTESSSLIDTYTDARAKLNSDNESGRVKELERELASLRQRITKLESENQMLRGGQR